LGNFNGQHIFLTRYNLDTSSFSMSKTFRFGALALPLSFSIIIGLISGPLLAQDSPPPTQPTAQPAAQPAASASQPVVMPSPPPPIKDPYILDDGGLYIEPLYWLNRAQPTLAAGKTATAPGVFPYNGKALSGLGAEIGIPAGRANTLRVSYFRIQGNGNATLAQDATIFGESYTSGEFINATYKIQALKMSWDYLSYSWHKPNTIIRLKTLYEVQYVNTSVNMSAPFFTAVTDANGNTDYGTASGTKSLILPTFGLAMGSTLGKYFRWDLRGSGFGLPHRSDIGDVQGSVAVRLGKVELIAGEHFYHFKTSPKSDEYISDTLQGVFVALRFAWKGNL
jgi:hypothetical protein